MEKEKKFKVLTTFSISHKNGIIFFFFFLNCLLIIILKAYVNMTYIRNRVIHGLTLQQVILKIVIPAMLNLQAGQECNWILFLSHVWHSTLVQTLCWILA